MRKNVAGQQIPILAWDKSNNTEKTGDAANITAQISLDGGATAATGDVNPTELDATEHPGIYIFDLTQAESNANLIILTPTSSSTDIHIEQVAERTEPGAIVGPLVGSTSSADFVGDPLKLAMFRAEQRTFTLTVTDADGDPIDLSAKTLKCTVETTALIPVLRFDAENITVSGDNDEIALTRIGDDQSKITPGVYQWRLWDTDVPEVLLHGTLAILSTSE